MRQSGKILDSIFFLKILKICNFQKHMAHGLLSKIVLKIDKAIILHHMNIGLYSLQTIL